MESTALIPLQYALDTFYLLISGALVMLMASGFAMLEAGLVRAKNTAEILAKNVTLYALASVMYLLVGYYLMYNGPAGGVWPHVGFLIGNEHAVEAVSAAGKDAPSFSARADFFFQVVFAATCMSIISGAVAERMRLWAFLAFAVVMCGLIYPIEGYWTWGGGFLKQVGFKDFAGSGVVHLAGASAALAGVILLGARRGKYGNHGQINAIPGANLPLAALGTLLLWVGWFGFNGGSQLKISSIEDANAVASVFVNTNMAAAGGLLAALVVARILFGKADLTMILNGALAGLVAITAEPSTPTAVQASLIGAVGGVLVVFSILLLDKLRIDDPVGAISVHGAGGIWGLLAVPLTNSSASLTAQMLGAACIFAWVFVASLIVWGLIKLIMGLRVSEEDEYEGMDIVECGMEAYPEFTRK
ncbi:ammonium transporter [Aquipseudomonas campi]